MQLCNFRSTNKFFQTEPTQKNANEHKSTYHSKEVKMNLQRRIDFKLIYQRFCFSTEIKYTYFFSGYSFYSCAFEMKLYSFIKAKMCWQIKSSAQITKAILMCWIILNYNNESNCWMCNVNPNTFRSIFSFLLTFNNFRK